MGGFDVKSYNKLPSLPTAKARFEEQLASAGITREQLFSELAPLFAEAPYAGHYAACLIHRHYDLNDGERMVAAGLSTKPSAEASLNIMCESWSSSGEEIEHRFTDNAAAPPPPADFFARFRSILDTHGIDILGVCHAPDNLADGFIFWESAGPSDREQVLTVVHSSAPEAANGVDAVWIPKFNSEGGHWTMVAGCSCNGSGCNCPCGSPEACTCKPSPGPPPPPPSTSQTSHQVGKPLMPKEGQKIAGFGVAT